MSAARCFPLRTLSPVLLATTLFATAPSVGAEDSKSFQIYQENWEQAETARAAGDYARAATHYQKVAEVFPFEPTARFQLACCYARLGQNDQALSTLQGAVRFGWEDVSKLEQADDLKPLRAKPQFAQLLKAAAACRDENLIIHAGNKVDPLTPAPLLVVLQGLGSFRADLPYWMPAADELGCVLIMPRAVTKAAPMMSGWHRRGAKDSSAPDYFDLPAAGKRIDEAIAEAGHRFKIDPDRIVLAGFSQGAGVALRLIGDHPERYCGAVAVAGLHQPPSVAYWQSILKQHPIRVYVIAGKLDRLLPRSQKVVEQLRAAQVPHRYDELNQIGHEFPQDYTKRLKGAIEFVLRRRGE
jgi:phospholipase/carboxylesterase